MKVWKINAGMHVPWDEVRDGLTADFGCVRNDFGPEEVFGGLYDGANVERFHHVKSPLRLFRKTAPGGFVSSVGSAGASSFLFLLVVGSCEAISPHDIAFV